MEQKLAALMCQYMLKNKIIQPDLFDVYCYGTELLLSFVMSTSIIVILGIVCQRITQTIVFLVLFIFLRRFTGGYHANTYLVCKAFTVGTYIVVISLSEISTVTTAHFFLTALLGTSIIFIWGPIENPNKPLTLLEKKKYKTIALVLYFGCSVIGHFIRVLSASLSSVICYTLISVIALMILSIFKEGGVRQ